MDGQYFVSCSTGLGLADLETGMTSLVKGMLSSNSNKKEGVLITRERHRRHIKECLFHLDTFLDMNLPMDLAAEELRLAILCFTPLVSKGTFRMVACTTVL